MIAIVIIAAFLVIFALLWAVFFGLRRATMDSREMDADIRRELGN